MTDMDSPVKVPVKMVSKEELIKNCDVLSMHVPWKLVVHCTNCPRNISIQIDRTQVLTSHLGFQENQEVQTHPE